jgi:hypothetical protein
VAVGSSPRTSLPVPSPPFLASIPSLPCIPSLRTPRFPHRQRGRAHNPGQPTAGAHATRRHEGRRTDCRSARSNAGPEPPVGSVAMAVRDAIAGDPVLRPITAGPGDFAIRMTADGAYPDVDVLAEVRRAAEYASRQPGRYVDGRKFLTSWLKRAADDAAARPRPLPGAPATAANATKGYRPAATGADFARERGGAPIDPTKPINHGWRRPNAPPGRPST